jgi:hypothetical protein
MDILVDWRIRGKVRPGKRNDRLSVQRQDGFLYLWGLVGGDAEAFEGREYLLSSVNGPKTP